MIWHIFKKDWKLLWPLVLIVAAAHIMNAALQFRLGHFGEPRELVQIARFFPNVVLLGMAALIVTAVHQEPVPGDRQDWLVRPIRRRDLILAKLLFLVVAVHGPMLLVDLAHGMVTGFRLWDSLSAALSRGIYLLLSFSVPVLALAAMTSTIVEVIGGALAGFLIFVVLEVATDGLAHPLVDSTMGWMIPSFWSAVILAASAAVVPLQYFRRSTMYARSIAFGAALLVPVSYFVPWAPAFAFQQRLSADPAEAKDIAVAFDPNLGKFTIKPGEQSRASSAWLPLRVSGLPPESLLIDDRTYVRITGRDGAVLFRGVTTGDPQTTHDPGFGPFHIDDFPVRTTIGGDVRTHQLITLPAKIYELGRGQQVRIELDYSLTIFRTETADTINALSGDKRIANLGWCKTRLGDDDVEIGCIKPGDPPTCATFVLENPISGKRNPASNPCRPDYTPYPGHFYSDAMSTIRSGLSFSDPQGLAKYPVDSLQLTSAQVSMKTYKPMAHFTRHLTIPEIRLGDWEAEISEGTTTKATP